MAGVDIPVTFGECYNFYEHYYEGEKILEIQHQNYYFYYFNTPH